MVSSRKLPDPGFKHKFLTSFTQDWGDRLLEGTSRALSAPGPMRKEWWPHKRLTQTCCECPGDFGRGVGWLWPAIGLGALNVAVHAWDILKEAPIIFITSTIVWPQVNNREGTQPHPSTQNWIKDLSSMAHTSEQDAISSSVRFSHQEAPICLLSFSVDRQTENHNHRKLTNLITWNTALSNTLKLWAMFCRAPQDGQVMVETSDTTLSTGEGNGKPLQYFCFENPRNNRKRQKAMTMNEELPGSVGTQYTTGEERRNNSRKNEEMEPKKKQHPVVDVTGAGNKVQCCKEQYCIQTWNVRSMNWGKLEVVKQEKEMATHSSILT